MDLITLAMLNGMKQSGGVGSTHHNKVVVNRHDIDNGDLTVNGIGFSYISPLTPTKEELANGHIFMRMWNDETGEAAEIHEMSVGNVMIDDGVVYGGTLDLGNIKTNYVFAVAYKSGEWEAGGVTIDKPGLYISYIHSFPEDVNVNFIFEWETINKIDQKYLPGVCLPVVELTTAPTEEGAQLTAEESAKMDEVAALGVPIVAKVPFGHVITNSVYNFAIGNAVNAVNTVMYATSISHTTFFAIIQTETGWALILQNVE